MYINNIVCNRDIHWSIKAPGGHVPRSTVATPASILRMCPSTLNASLLQKVLLVMLHLSAAWITSMELILPCFLGHHFTGASHYPEASWEKIKYLTLWPSNNFVYSHTKLEVWLILEKQKLFLRNWNQVPFSYFIYNCYWKLQCNLTLSSPACSFWRLSGGLHLPSEGSISNDRPSALLDDSAKAHREEMSPLFRIHLPHSVRPSHGIGTRTTWEARARTGRTTRSTFPPWDNRGSPFTLHLKSTGKRATGKFKTRGLPKLGEGDELLRGIMRPG